MNIHSFSFNAFQVNTYIIWDETKECIIVDAACYQEFEKKELKDFLAHNGLKPVKLLNTHCHIDHILGNPYIEMEFGLRPYIHAAGKVFLQNAVEHAWSFGFELEKVVDPIGFVEDGEEISFGNSRLKVLYTPGHADGSICLLSEESGFVVTGDVLFNGSIGRTDLPTGDFNLLIESITNKLLSLPSDITVFPGHGPSSSIGDEKMHNPFLTASDY